jgi:hypothetical protein
VKEHGVTEEYMDTYNSLVARFHFVNETTSKHHFSEKLFYHFQ